MCVFTGVGFGIASGRGILIGQGIHQQLPLHPRVVAGPSKIGGWLLMHLGSWVLMIAFCLLHWPRTESRGRWRKHISFIYFTPETADISRLTRKTQMTLRYLRMSLEITEQNACNVWRTLSFLTTGSLISEVLTQCIPVAVGVDTIPGEFPCIFPVLS